jgi:hypothetical protein
MTSPITPHTSQSFSARERSVVTVWAAIKFQILNLEAYIRVSYQSFRMHMTYICSSLVVTYTDTRRFINVLKYYKTRVQKHKNQLSFFFFVLSCLTFESTIFFYIRSIFNEYKSIFRRSSTLWHWPRLKKGILGFQLNETFKCIIQLQVPLTETVSDRPSVLFQIEKSWTEFDKNYIRTSCHWMTLKPILFNLLQPE